jgi:aspartate/tyrosine/aromatic aminotransferase
MTNENEPRDYTPEELQKIYAKFKKAFTVEDLIGYIENDGEKYPIEQVIAEAEEIVRNRRASEAEGA